MVGELDKIYATIDHIQQSQNTKIDLLIICGDFQAIRNIADLSCLACPEKFRKLGTFYEYYNGSKKTLLVICTEGHESNIEGNWEQLLGLEK